MFTLMWQKPSFLFVWLFLVMYLFTMYVCVLALLQEHVMFSGWIFGKKNNKIHLSKYITRYRWRKIHTTKKYLCQVLFLKILWGLFLDILYKLFFLMTQKIWRKSIRLTEILVKGYFNKVSTLLKKTAFQLRT